MTYDERMKLLKLCSKYRIIADNYLFNDHEKYREYSNRLWKIHPLQSMSPKEWKEAEYSDFV